VDCQQAENEVVKLEGTIMQYEAAKEKHVVIVEDMQKDICELESRNKVMEEELEELREIKRHWDAKMAEEAEEAARRELQEAKKREAALAKKPRSKRGK